MTPLFQDIQKTLLPHIGGILWITSEAINENPPAFSELDYFFNHMLSKYLLTMERADKSYFSTSQFDKNLFLGHFEVNSPNLAKNLEQILSLGTAKLDNRAVLLISKKEYQKHFDTLISKNKSLSFQKFFLPDA